MTIYELPADTLAFPDPDNAEDDGLLAVGGDLSVDRLITAYSRGIFPWYSHRSPILWWAPDPRFVLFPQNIHISRSLRKQLRTDRFTVTCNRSFRSVIEHCRTIPRAGQNGTWITPEMRSAYISLHQYGFAASVETWEDDTLVGGLYGVVLGRVFFGESMFSQVPDASKTALTALARILGSQDVPCIDCQIYTKHLDTMGAQHMPFNQFRTVLEEATQQRRPEFPEDIIRTGTLIAG